MSEQEMRDVAIPVELLFRVPDLLSVSARNDQIKGLERFVEDVLEHGTVRDCFFAAAETHSDADEPDGGIVYDGYAVPGRWETTMPMFVGRVRRFWDRFEAWRIEQCDGDPDGDPDDQYEYDSGLTEWGDEAFELVGHMPDTGRLDSHGVKWVPWSDGRAIGFRCEHPDGRVEYVYLNPSSDSDDGTSNVFVYQGTEGDPVQDPAYTHYVMFQEDSDA